MEEQSTLSAYAVKSIAYRHKQTDYVVPHAHEYTEIIYYVKGKGLTNVYGDTPYNFCYCEDSLIIVPPQMKHDEYSATDTEIVCNQVDVKGECFSQPQFIKKTAKNSELFDRIKNRMTEINQLYSRLKKGKDRKAEERLIDILGHLEIDVYRLVELSDKKGRFYYADTVNAVKTYIRKYFHSKIDFSILANDFGYSYDRFRHIFREYTGMTLYAYLQGLRLNDAKRLLAVTNMKIGEIALKTGFSGSVRFCEWFNKMVGVSPLKYRDMNKMLKWGVVWNLSDMQENMRTVNLMLDTDLGCDCDDAAAIAIVNVFQRERTVNVLCMTQCLNDTDAGRAIDWINGYYGNDFEIGISDNSLVEAEKYLPRYVYKLREEFDKSKKLYSSVELMKEKLRKAEAGSVTMVFIGQLNNFAKLLSSAEGKDLVREKVCKIVIMGGNFSDYGEYYLFRGQKFSSEFNIGLDVESAKIVTDCAELPLEFIDFNQGLKVLTGKVLKEQMKNPVARIYDLFGVTDRESWDLIAVLYAILGGGGMFEASEYGKVAVSDDGRTTFRAGEGKHRILELKKSKEATEQINDILVRIGEIKTGEIKK